MFSQFHILSKIVLGKEKYLVLLATGLFVSAGVLHVKYPLPPMNLSKQQTALNINKDAFRFLSIGNKRLLASQLWIQTLIESDLEQYQKRDLNNWMFLRFNTISELDPLFYENYLYGGMFLSIVKDDPPAAALIYEKGITHYPQDFKLHYNAGFNYYVEMNDYQKGLDHWLLIENHPQAPRTIKYIINKLKFETSHNYEAAIAFLNFQIETSSDEVLVKKLRQDLYSLTAQRDLECLNRGEKNCSHVDIEGKPYIRNDNEWTSQKKFLPYKIFKRK